MLYRGQVGSGLRGGRVKKRCTDVPVRRCERLTLVGVRKEMKNKRGD